MPTTLMHSPSRRLVQSLGRSSGTLFRRSDAAQTRRASAQAAADVVDDSSLSGLSRLEEAAKSYDPLERTRNRPKPLPASRYQFRSPRFYRGPLHPYQPPPASDPHSREFVPGPFTTTRVKQTYESTIASDLMTLTYTHHPPGTLPGPSGQRLRSWDGSSPYHKNRPLRKPKGASSSLPLLRPPITFNNIPQLERVTIHTMASNAKNDSAYLHVAGMVLQAISNNRVVAHKARHNVAGWGLRAGNYVSAVASLRGEDMYHFLGKIVDVVLPRIKDWRGVKGTSGDGSGNLAFGLSPDAVRLFPEIEVNYDMYPQKMIPGCHIVIHTTATTDRDARLLLNSIGIPFTGQIVD